MMNEKFWQEFNLKLAGNDPYTVLEEKVDELKRLTQGHDYLDVVHYVATAIKNLWQYERLWILIEGSMGYGKTSLAEDILELAYGEFDKKYYFNDATAFLNFIEDIIEKGEYVEYVLLDDIGVDLEKWRRTQFEILLFKILSLSRSILRVVVMTDNYLLEKWIRRHSDIYIVNQKISHDTIHINVYTHKPYYDDIYPTFLFSSIYKINTADERQEHYDKIKRNKIIELIKSYRGGEDGVEEG